MTTRAINCWEQVASAVGGLDNYIILWQWMVLLPKICAVTGIVTSVKVGCILGVKLNARV